MRFGISATSWIFPKNLRTRLRPVNVCAAILFSRFVEPPGPGRLSGRPPSIATIRTGVGAPFSEQARPCRPNRQLSTRFGQVLLRLALNRQLAPRRQAETAAA